MRKHRICGKNSFPLLAFVFRDASRWRRDQEAGLRQEAENKKREAERLRGEVSICIYS